MHRDRRSDHLPARRSDSAWFYVQPPAGICVRARQNDIRARYYRSQSQDWGRKRLAVRARCETRGNRHAAKPLRPQTRRQFIWGMSWRSIKAALKLGVANGLSVSLRLRGCLLAFLPIAAALRTRSEPPGFPPGRQSVFAGPVHPLEDGPQKTKKAEGLAFAGILQEGRHQPF